MLGELSQALRDAARSVQLAERSGDLVRCMLNRTTLADALHQAGQLDESEDAFRKAEAMQKEQNPQHQLLYSVQGYWYCDLLLDQVEPLVWPTPPRGEAERLRQACQAVQDRACHRSPAAASSAATPGRGLPSSHSRKAPPAVET